MRHLLVFIVPILLCTPVFAQNTADTIRFNKKGSDYHFYKNGKELSIEKVSKILRPDQDATKLLRKAKADYYIGLVLAGAGGGFLGVTLGNATSGGKIQPGFIIASVACLAIAFPITISGNHLERKAVRKYNDDLMRNNKTTFRTIRPEYYLSFAPNLIGLTMRF